MRYLWILIFWAMQTAAQIFFKAGTFKEHPERWLPCFIAGNVFGASSIWILMILYKAMNVNIALAVGAGGAFLVVQIILAWVFRSQLTMVQWAGIVVIAAGMVMASLGGVKPSPGV